MGMPWFRLYAEFATDAKVQTLSEIDQRRYIMLLCMQCATCNGNVTFHETLHVTDETFHVTDVIFYLRITAEEWAKTLANLMAKNLVTEDGRPTAWKRRQFISDSSSNRVKRFREKHRKGTHKPTRNMKRFSNVSETPPDTDTDTDTEGEEIVKKTISSGPPKKISQISQNVKIVFDYWKKTLNHPQAIFDERRKRLITARLKTHTVENLMLAIDGCKGSSFHMGQNEDGKIFDGIDLIFRNTDKLEYFINLNKKTSQKSKSEILREKNLKNLFGDAI